MSAWDFWIDRGGTFTDVVARDPEGRIHVRKVLSEDPGRYEDAPLFAIRSLLGLGAEDPVPAHRIRALKMGTTVATNALLERKGDPFVLLITRGFADLLEIGTQNRPEIFALEIKKPSTLAARVVEVDERIDAAGRPLRRPSRAALRPVLQELYDEGFRSLAVVFLHSYRSPDHEELVGGWAAELGFQTIALSHRAAREIKAVARGDTACVDAYLTPILRRYIARLRAHLDPGVPLRFMQSHGGLADAEAFSGKDAILSGPAGGVVACAEVARRAGIEKVIGFDMGGTSTDVSRYDGRFDRVFETITAGVRIQAPMLDIVTVAAGGGSLLRFEDGRFKVGPESAGADPGPACYRRGGPLAVTDANAVLGRLLPEHFPSCFGPEADQPLDVEASRRAFSALAEAVKAETGRAFCVAELAAGFLRVANDSMVKPIREVSVARGYDVRDYALLCFGGAGAQHACAIADQLGVETILLHPHAGVLSAYGMGLADLVHAQARSVLATLDDGALADLEPAFQELESEGRGVLAEQGVAEQDMRLARSLDLRTQGVDEVLNIPVAPGDDAESVRRAFEEAHERLYAFKKSDQAIELVNLRIEARGLTDKPEEPEAALNSRRLGAEDAGRSAPVTFEVLDAEGRRVLEEKSCPVFEREALSPGTRVEGPALIVEAVSTIVLEPGWSLLVDGRRVLRLTRSGAAARERLSGERDPVLLEVFNNLFMSIAEQMGLTLRKVSHSTNIKERLDFSCALFDRAGQLIANAPHIPVHLGAMGESVRAIFEARVGSMKPGDTYLTNDPYNGGSHLPDVTVVTPVFLSGEAPEFFVASRGHHADIGGVSPGSMPPFSTSIEEEGVLLTDLKLVDAGVFDEEGIRAALSAGPYPARNMAERLSDLKAKIAANAAGLRLLQEMTGVYGAEVVAAYMDHVRANAAEAMRAVIGELPDGEHAFFDHLDEGARIAVTITIAGEEATVDFAGTDPCLRSNLNAPSAVARAAVLYAFRTLIPRSVPLNAGCLEPITLKIPKGSLLDPVYPAAVVGGNVETSQRITDAVYGALKKLAAGQGTMNNLTFGNERYGYYETICGGAGAGLGFDGASAVHTHMTNTRITDPEVLEHRYPVRLERFAIREGSGGEGVWRGGDGVVRELRFLEAMQVSLLSERRALAPYGIHGAAPGARGRNLLRRGDRDFELPGKLRLGVEPQDLLVIETPGGGGYNPSAAQRAALSPSAARALFEDRYHGPSAGFAAGAVQANLVILPRTLADDFEAYCRANPRPCPLLERLEAGDPRVRVLARGADLRSCLPRYRIYRRDESGGGGAVFDELTDIREHWDGERVAFLLGCSFGFEGALEEAGIVPRHVEEGVNVPMYRSHRATEPRGPFAGPLVVSMRPMSPEDARRAEDLTAGFEASHGGPIHIGDPAALGIAELSAPDYGEAVSLRPGEVPVFWACGVTSQEAVMSALRAGAAEQVITHAPGHMFIGDIPAREARLWP